MKTDDPSVGILTPESEMESGEVTERGIRPGLAPRTLRPKSLTPKQLTPQITPKIQDQIKVTPKIFAPLLTYGPSWQAKHGMTSSQYQSAFDAFTRDGYRLVYVSGYTDNGQERFAALWEKKSGPAWVARHGMNGAQYQSEFDKHVGQGFRLVLVNGYTVNGQDRYVAIWEKSSGPAWVARHGMTGAQYQTEFDKHLNQGYRLVHISGYAVGNDARYAAIWEKSAGPVWLARHGLTSAQYQAEFDKLLNQGYRLAHVSGYGIGNQDFYAAIWEKTSGPAWAARHGMSSSDYQGEFNNYYYQGYRLKLINGYTVGNHDRYTAIWYSAGISPDAINVIDNKIQAYMKQHSLPGMSLAIVKDGRLVFAKGYGYADKGTGERVNPADRFRIASVSKPVTSIAIMKLIEQNKFSLDSKVFGSGGLLGTKYGTKPYSARVKKITVRHLLSHTSGWSNENNDPMFSNPSYNHSQLIGWVLDNRAVKNEPGSAYEYFNFGYCLLGRIIEAVTGQSYDAHVKQAILAPSGISRMEIGGDTLAQRKPDEVVYYQPGSNPYGMKVARMDAHGGWIATPIDLLRLMVRADGFPTKPDLLQPGSITAMWTGSSANMGYGLGWGLGSDNRSHNGAFSGGIANLVRLNNGFEFAFVVNTRPATDDFGGKGQAVLTDIVSTVTAWPAYDLF